ncbi:hypothetical protein AB6A40_006493 [Gnathostoma spinigerum]|uniref:G-protein coupled receptors family 1 profile domain-containing protein n=1 Tax=Gnathostoma spinigerum TaxID=75299 RepID=A0ABD6EII9_9BILA
MIAFAVEDENYSDSNSNLTGASSADHYYVEGSPSEFDPIDPSKVTVNYILPLSNHENKGLMAIASLYAFLFMLGTCGNSAILAVVHHVKSTSKQARHNTTLTYICILSVVDFISMLPLPMTIVDQILGFWMFGTFACKVFRLFEHIGKVFSTFILVCFSIHRYCAVCHPLKVIFALRTLKSSSSEITLVFPAFSVFDVDPLAFFGRYSPSES